MGKKKTNEEIKTHQEKAIRKLNNYITSLIDSEESQMHGKADKLCYWLEDWCNYLKFEPVFSPNALRRYERGEIIKVHLGYNVGSEEGGLHYAVVVEKNNPKNSPVVTIVPLTSIKKTTNIENLRSSNVFLGNEIFTKLSTKISSTALHLKEDLEHLQKTVNSTDDTTFGYVKSRLEKTVRELDLLDGMRKEIIKMKQGSIALVNQITTISKIRIYDPKTDHDILSGIKLSNEKLNALDDALSGHLTK